jgi:preprotein translocase subunit SecF
VTSEALHRFLVPGTDPDVVASYETLAERARSTVFGFEDEVAVVDIETTGYDCDRDHVIEIAAAILRGPEVVATFEALVDPLVPVPLEITKLTGITDEMVAGQPSVESVVSRLIEFVGGRDVVAHNVAFDRSFLERVAGRHAFHGRWLDSLQLVRVGLPRLRSHRLADLSEAFTVRPEGAPHRALHDVLALAAVWRIALVGASDLPTGLLHRITDFAPQTEWPIRTLLAQIRPLRADVKQADLVTRVFAELCRSEGGTVTAREGPAEQGQSASRQACTAGAVEPVRLSRSEFVGPQVGKELAEDGAKALLFVVVGIMIYLAFRFEWKFSVAAIVANLHDVIIILGFFAFFQWEFSLSVLAAVLAVLGYSVNESVVIFDRIRESFRRYRKLTTHEVIDHAITSTISRTIITHGSTQMMVLSMLFFGGPTLHYFAIALTIGILFGIYSSVFVAAAIAMWLGVKREDLIGSAAGKAHDPDDPNAGAVV